MRYIEKHYFDFNKVSVNFELIYLSQAILRENLLAYVISEYLKASFLT